MQNARRIENVTSDAEHITTGKIGEAIAARYLVLKGHRVFDRNYRKPWGEIDLVTMFRNRLYFVEVKTVAHDSIVNMQAYREEGSFSPEQHVNTAKRLRLRRVINSWLAASKLDVSVQLDVLSVHLIKSEHFAAVDVFSNIDLYE